MRVPWDRESELKRNSIFKSVTQETQEALELCYASLTRIWFSFWLRLIEECKFGKMIEGCKSEEWLRNEQSPSVTSSFHFLNYDIPCAFPFTLWGKYTLPHFQWIAMKSQEEEHTQDSLIVRLIVLVSWLSCKRRRKNKDARHFSRVIVKSRDPVTFPFPSSKT